MCLTAAAVMWCAGFIWFALTLPRTIADLTTHTDAIVVLTGGTERIETGMNLLRGRLADRLFISGIGGPHPGESTAIPVNDPALGERITFGTAANTPGNAAETAAWAQREQLHSIRLVTAGYHMRRSLLELTAAMPEVTIIPHPVFPPRVKEDWWRWPGTASLIAREYTKYILTWLRQWLGIGVIVEIAQPTPYPADSPATSEVSPT